MNWTRIALLGLAVFFFALLVGDVPRASAAEGMIFAGVCDDGAWSNAHIKFASGEATPKCDAVMKAPAAAIAREGVKLREMTQGRPFDAKVIGAIPRGATIQVLSFRVLKSNDAKHVIWAKVNVADDVILRAFSYVDNYLDNGRLSTANAEAARYFPMLFSVRMTVPFRVAYAA